MYLFIFIYSELNCVRNVRNGVIHRDRFCKLVKAVPLVKSNHNPESRLGVGRTGVRLYGLGFRVMHERLIEINSKFDSKVLESVFLLSEVYWCFVVPLH